MRITIDEEFAYMELNDVKQKIKNSWGVFR